MGKRRFMILIGAMAAGMVLCIPGCGENAKGNGAKAVEAEVRAAASAEPESACEGNQGRHAFDQLGYE